MREFRDERRLTTILAADVVGYSGLMAENQVRTLELLRERWREVLEPLLAKYDGRLVKRMGDGVLVEFASVIHAVQCAIEMQQAWEVGNAALPERGQMQLRIGINLGEVIIEGSDLYGDGLQLAAHLESLAEPGGVCISETAYQHIREKLPLAYQDLGEQQVKNLAPMRVYRVSARRMGKIEEIKRAVSELGADELEKFRAWFEKFDAARFDDKIERDAQRGKLDSLAEAALAEFRNGRAREL